LILKRLLFFTLFLLFICSNLFAQKEDRNWVFGYNAGIDFNNNKERQFPVYNFESSTSFSDTNGHIELYTGIYSTISPLWNDYYLFNGEIMTQLRTVK
jgi:hypothetical protein